MKERKESGEMDRVNKTSVARKKFLRNVNGQEHKICVFCLHTKNKPYLKTNTL